MHLAAVMDLVDEQMCQQVADALGDLTVLAPVGDDTAIEVACGQPLAKRDQPAVRRRLRLEQRLRTVERNEAVKRGGPERTLFEEVEIEAIDREDVVERLADRREKAGALGFELAGAKASTAR